MNHTMVKEYTDKLIDEELHNNGGYLDIANMRELIITAYNKGFREGVDLTIQVQRERSDRN